MWSAVEPAAGDLATLYGDPNLPYGVTLTRFARDLRIGGFENLPERAAFARDILWRLTVAKLRMANPRFLAANGFS